MSSERVSSAFAKNLKRRVFCGLRVADLDRFRDVETLTQLGRIDRDGGAETGRYLFIAPPFVADSKFFALYDLQNVAAVGVHHSAEFGDDNIEKAFEIDTGRKIAGEAVDDALARLVHLDLAVERERLLFDCFFAHLRRLHH